MLSTLETTTFYISLCILAVTTYFAVSLKKEKKSSSKPNKTVYINGMSSAFPKHRYEQSQMKSMFIKNYCGGRDNVREDDLSFIDRVFANTLIQRCYVNLEEHRLFEQMNREVYTDYVKSTMLSIAVQAASEALRQSCYLPKHVTHLVFGTTTPAIRAPSLDFYIIRELALNPTVKRLNVELMGCLTGFRLVGLCRDILDESNQSVILLITCDILSSLGNQLTPYHAGQPIDKSNVISAALFRDSAGAAVFSLQDITRNKLCVLDHRSSIVPDSLHHVVLQEFCNGSIHLYLDKGLPDAAARHTPTVVNAFLVDYGVEGFVHKTSGHRTDSRNYFYGEHNFWLVAYYPLSFCSSCWWSTHSY
jgi:predicted naringenin-chalcone synthase